jgi:hypothetical protein
MKVLSSNNTQTSTSKHPPSVILCCASHDFCTASVRLRTTPEGDFVIDGSIDPHEETLVAQTRGITPDGLHLRDRLFAIHKGNPVAVYNELLGGKDDNERDYRVTC